MLTLTNINVTFASTAGATNVIPFYNVNIVNTAVVTVYGSGKETLILVATDTQPSNTPVSAPGAPVLNPPHYATNIVVNVRNYASTYMSFNMYNYPLVMNNVTWSGVASSPGPYIPSSVAGPTSPAGASPAPTVAPVQGSRPPTGNLPSPGMTPGGVARMDQMRRPPCPTGNCNLNAQRQQDTPQEFDSEITGELDPAFGF